MALCVHGYISYKFHLDLFVCNAIATVQGPYCSQLLLVPVQCTVSFIIYAGPIWSDKASPSSEVITNNNDDKTQRIFFFFALFWKWLFCVAWWNLLDISRGTWQPFANLPPSDPYQAGASGSSFGWELLPFTIPAGLPWPEVRLCKRWIHDHFCERGYLNVL